MKKTFPIIICLLLIPTQAADARNLLKAHAAKPAGFIDIRNMTVNPREYPFHRAWVKEGVDFSQYKKVYIAPVNTAYIFEISWPQKAGGKTSIEEDLDTLAKFTHNAFIDAFKNDPEKKFQITEAPAPRTLVIEFAIVEVVPSKGFLKSVSYASGLMGPIGVAGGLIGRKFLTTSSAAFEARIKDGGTDEVIATFADREQEKTAIIKIKDFSWYEQAEGIIEDWADQFVQIFQREPNQRVKDSSWIDLNPFS